MYLVLMNQSGRYRAVNGEYVESRWDARRYYSYLSAYQDKREGEEICHMAHDGIVMSCKTAEDADKWEKTSEERRQERKRTGNHLRGLGDW
jgi:hypothetical protein